MPFCPGGIPYVIRPGDTYFSLARRFGTTVDALIAANPGVDPNNLQIGMTICIPVAPVPGPCPGGFTYVIRGGDTFFSLARRFGISVEALMAANPGVDPNNLRIGQTICIPVMPAPPFCPPWTTPYTIQAGDTLFSIARRFRIELEDILSTNPGVDPHNLRIGQVICLPTGPR
ncbi:MAG TPA: LysM peptidoglycan-binding domain-containing protein [Syntrophomonadaceae bacterium]|nr:LysM peptidoglycan-binding domain-containing protein [Syntrophomonadaceae bacterium]